MACLPSPINYTQGRVVNDGITWDTMGHNASMFFQRRFFLCGQVKKQLAKRTLKEQGKNKFAAAYAKVLTAALQHVEKQGSGGL